MGNMWACKVGRFGQKWPFLGLLKHLEQTIIPKPFTTEFDTKNENLE